MCRICAFRQTRSEATIGDNRSNEAIALTLADAREANGCRKRHRPGHSPVQPMARRTQLDHEIARWYGQLIDKSEIGCRRRCERVLPRRNVEREISGPISWH